MAERKRLVLDGNILMIRSSGTEAATAAVATTRPREWRMAGMRRKGRPVEADGRATGGSDVGSGLLECSSCITHGAVSLLSLASARCSSRSASHTLMIDCRVTPSREAS